MPNHLQQGRQGLLHNKLGRYWQCFTSSFAIIALIFLFFNILTFIPDYVMNTYKFGNFTNAFLVLNEIGCAIVKHRGLEVTPYTPDPKTDPPPKDPKTDPPPKICSLQNVTIHSRLGNTYYLQVSHMRFTIPTQNVLSWTVNEVKKGVSS